ncbi:ER membrane associated esterase/lipase [Schizosaccharomyces osmophilus]|uniref:ER membrane associated esterase/lipase n=1 Tax=Schizosaccharomyces osmophilus TaxID=2545709 RepID=A0AAE9W777_9SCHI|nr:ER membrane associated esterase/lipase [Schizosaccharomyces osmophilus]WBW70779.1 ER membrane associated esterase/lipase [Schizosaccharomyces osmophilus]
MGLTIICYAIWVAVSSLFIVSAFQLEVHKFLSKLIPKFYPGVSKYNVASLSAFVSEKSLEFASVKFLIMLFADKLGASSSSVYGKVFFLDMFGLGSLLSLIVANVIGAYHLDDVNEKLFSSSTVSSKSGFMLTKHIGRLSVNVASGSILRYPYISYLPNWLLAKNNAERLVYKSHLLLNVFSPDDKSKNHPVVLWACGRNKAESVIIPYLASLGFVVVVPNYAQPPRYSTSESVLFIKLCVEWISECIHCFHGDPSQLYAVGEDTGAAVVMECLSNELPADTIHGLFALAPRNNRDLQWSIKQSVHTFTLIPGFPDNNSEDAAKQTDPTLHKTMSLAGTVPYFYKFSSPRTLATGDLIAGWLNHINTSKKVN